MFNARFARSRVGAGLCAAWPRARPRLVDARVPRARALTACAECQLATSVELGDIAAGSARCRHADESTNGRAGGNEYSGNTTSAMPLRKSADARR